MKRKKFLVIIIAMSVVLILLFMMAPSIRVHINNQVYKTLIRKVTNEALPSNLKIIRSVETKSENVTGTSFKAGFSGVVIGSEGDTYYALTARHALLEEDNSENIEFVVLGYDEQNINEFVKSGGKFLGVVEYYELFPRAEIVYSSEQYDLALIRFTTDKKYLVLPIASESPKGGETIVSMSNVHEERNVITIGKIKRGERVKFGDDLANNEYPMVLHTASCSMGSSGSALLNQNLEIVGIELGGNENIFRRFISGMMMPSDRILEFLGESGYEIIK